MGSVDTTTSFSQRTEEHGEATEQGKFLICVDFGRMGLKLPFFVNHSYFWASFKI